MSRTGRDTEQRQLRSLTQLTTSGSHFLSAFFSAIFKSQSFGVAVKFNKSITRFLHNFLFFIYFFSVCFYFWACDRKNQVFTSIHLGDIPNFLLFLTSLSIHTKGEEVENQKNHFKSTESMCYTFIRVVWKI